jgi:hypothetical protein
VANYGDVALRLRADWSRGRYENQEQVLMTVGHEDGVADLYLTKEPDTEHQFQWVNPADRNEVTRARMRGYDFVLKDTWTKRLDYLWEWNAEGYVWTNGQIAMARPKSKWLEDEAKRDVMTNRVRSEADKDLEVLPKGLIAEQQEASRGKRKSAVR